MQDYTRLKLDVAPTLDHSKLIENTKCTHESKEVDPAWDGTCTRDGTHHNGFRYSRSSSINAAAARVHFCVISIMASEFKEDAAATAASAAAAGGDAARAVASAGSDATRAAAAVGSSLGADAVSAGSAAARQGGAVIAGAGASAASAASGARAAMAGAGAGAGQALREGADQVATRPIRCSAHPLPPYVASFMPNKCPPPRSRHCCCTTSPQSPPGWFHGSCSSTVWHSGAWRGHFVV